MGERLIEIDFEDVGNGHDVGCNFVAERFDVVAEVDRFVDFFCVGGDAVHADEGFILREDVVVVSSAYVGHYRNFCIAFVGDFPD